MIELILLFEIFSFVKEHGEHEEYQNQIERSPVLSFVPIFTKTEFKWVQSIPFVVNTIIHDSYTGRN